MNVARAFQPEICPVGGLGGVWVGTTNGHEWTRMTVDGAAWDRFGEKAAFLGDYSAGSYRNPGFGLGVKKNGPSGFLVGPVAERWTVEARHSRASHAWINLSVRRP